MQHLENDMDELFQRAAENYPLQEGKGDWESIAKRMSDTEGSPEIVVVTQRKGIKKIIAMALVLFILVSGWILFQNNKKSLYGEVNRTEVKKDAEIIASDSKTNSTNVQDAIRGEMTDKAGKSKTDVSVIDNNKRNIVQQSGNTTTKIISGTVYISSYPKEKESVANDNGQDHSANYEVIKGFLNKQFFVPGIIKTNPGGETAERYNNSSDKTSAFFKTINEDAEAKSNKMLLEADKAAAIFEKKSRNTPVISIESKGVYIGVAIAPDFSKVQSGSFTNTGFDAGILLGYRFNRRLSLETGFMWNKKVYISDGKYFSMDKVGSTMPAGMIIDNLKSNCSVIEIPLKVKYDLISKSNSDLFVAGGVSSYIVTKENNSYNVTLNGNHEKISGVYNKNNYGLPAVANVSMGYEHSISRNIDIRLEPFLKIPLKGMGVGSLQVTSAGLQIGITGRLK
ncbi:MAG: outer membrane beta-barrel protein [Ginsengibacter sp.]